MRFVAVDVETANAFMGSICQVGIATYQNGQLMSEWCTLVDPEEDFDGMNVCIHGIEPEMVVGQPKLPDIAEKIRSYMEGSVSICHTPFDRTAFTLAFEKYELQSINTIWLDTAKVVRRTWKELAYAGYGLGNVCRMLEYEFKHHNALEDAKAAAQILLSAMQASQLNLEDWLFRVRQPINPHDDSIRREGNPEGDLFGEVMVFTGALEVPRRIAADMAASVGCEVAPSVTKKTTILVVGDLDVSRLAGQEKSGKYRKAEHLVREGQPIRIIRESDFKKLVQNISTP